MREDMVEDYLRRQTRDVLGGKAYKFVSPGQRSVPDRILVWDDDICFVECKAPGKKPTKKQGIEILEIANMGHKVTWVDSYEAVDELLIKLLSGDPVEPGI